MWTEGYITGWQDDTDVSPGGYVQDSKRTVTFHFKNGQTGTDVTLPWPAPLPTMDDPRWQLYRLTIEPIENI